MSTDVTNVVFAGLGGQGVLTASDLLADVAMAAGCDVKKSEVHGMSQRGGSVRSDVRYGRRVGSPMVPAAEGDFLLCSEPAEVETYRAALAPGGELYAPDAIDAAALPNRKCLNVALLGLLSRRLEFPVEAWEAALRARFPEKLHEVNLAAFTLGRRGGKG